MQKAECLLPDNIQGVKGIKPRRKQFESREDGMVFWAYDKTYRNGERWVTMERAIELRDHRNWRNRNNPNKKASWRKWYEQNKEYKDAQTRAWQVANKAHLSKYNSEKTSKKIKEDPLFCLRMRVRKRTSKAFNLFGYTKNSKSNEILGCSWEELKAQFEKQFKPGMTWGNRHLWHVDHIIPLASATSEEELVRLCHHSNLQPLWAKENLIKANKMPK
jgi:hypothetical protein